MRNLFDPGSGMEKFESETQDKHPGFDLFLPGSRVDNISDPGSGSASKNLSIFNPKKLYYVLKNKIRDIHLGSWIWIFFHPRSWIRIPDPGVKKAPDPGSGFAILNFS
jgi:hypothetical protein